MLQRLHLLGNFFRYFGIAVTAVYDGYASEAVEELAALAVVEILHASLDEFARLPVEMGQAGHDVFLLFLNDGFRAYVFFLHIYLPP